MSPIIPPADRRLIVSLHDVHQGSWRSLRCFLGELEGLGIRRTTLLAVPRWQGRQSLADDRALAAWLRERVAAGHEVCLHGFTHAADRVSGGPLRQLVGRVYTAREGEFYQLAYAQARERLRIGRQILRAAGLSVVGFTPPAWLLGPGARHALADEGFLYTTSFGGIDQIPAGVRIAAPTLVLSSRSAWRRGASLLVSAVADLVTGPARVLRLAVHPRDLESRPMRERLLQLARHALATRHAVTYADLVAHAVPTSAAAAAGQG